jgi:hypothetical protein
LDDSPKTKTSLLPFTSPQDPWAEILRASDALRMTTLIGSLHFFVSSLLAAGIAKFLGFQPLGMLLLILCGGVIPILAVTTLQRNNFPHFSNPFQKSADRHGRPASENCVTR